MESVDFDVVCMLTVLQYSSKAKWYKNILFMASCQLTTTGPCNWSFNLYIPNSIRALEEVALLRMVAPGAEFCGVTLFRSRNR